MLQHFGCPFGRVGLPSFLFSISPFLGQQTIVRDLERKANNFGRECHILLFAPSYSAKGMWKSGAATWAKVRGIPCHWLIKVRTCPGKGKVSPRTFGKTRPNSRRALSRPSRRDFPNKRAHKQRHNNTKMKTKMCHESSLGQGELRN